MVDFLNLQKAKKDFESNLREVLVRRGLQGLNEHVTTKLNRWEQERISIAITGNSGAGKSSLINALRGIDQSDENAAEEGVTETTTDIKAYPFPSNRQIYLYDLPGVGTTSREIEAYKREMDFQQYHFVVIVSAHRFTANDAVIVKEVQRLNKPFFLVRSKIKFDVKNQKKTQSRGAVLAKIRKDCLSHLREQHVNCNDVFLVDNHVHEDFELGKLQMSIVNKAPEALQSSLVFSYRNMTKEVIDGKIQYLKIRALGVAAKAVTSAVPGGGLLINVHAITDEITFYKVELGLDDESLAKTCGILGVDKTELKNMISLTDSKSFKENIKSMFQDDKLDLKELCVGFILIGLKSILAASIKSYANVLDALWKLLDNLHQEALEICELILEKIGQ